MLTTIQVMSQRVLQRGWDIHPCQVLWCQSKEPQWCANQSSMDWLQARCSSSLSDNVELSFSTTKLLNIQLSVEDVKQLFYWIYGGLQLQWEIAPSLDSELDCMSMCQLQQQGDYLGPKLFDRFTVPPDIRKRFHFTILSPALRVYSWVDFGKEQRGDHLCNSLQNSS